MTLDSVANFIKRTLSQGYDQNATSIVLTSGTALPSASWNATWWNATDYPDPSDDPNVEIVRVTAVNSNTLTITRGQEGTTASTKNAAGKVYKLMLGMTAKMLTDIGANLQKPWRLVVLDGAIDGVNTTYTLHGSLTPFDPNSLDVKIARQPQEQGIDYTFSGVTVTYVIPLDASLAGQPHTARYQ